MGWWRLALVGVVPPDARHLLLLGDLLRWHWRRYFRDKEEEENRGVHGTSGLSRASGALPSAGATTNHDDGASRHVHGSRRTARLLSSRLRSLWSEVRVSD